MRTKETVTDSQPRQRERLIYAHAQNLSREVWAFARRRPGVFSTTSGSAVVAAVFCLVFLVMGTAFSFSTFAAELGRELKAGSGSISLIFGCVEFRARPARRPRGVRVLGRLLEQRFDCKLH